MQGLLLVLLIAGLSACATVDLDYPKSESTALQSTDDTYLGSYLTGRTNTAIKTSTGLRYEITDLLYANLSLDYNYETEPAGDLAENEDLRLVVGLGVEF